LLGWHEAVVSRLQGELADGGESLVNRGGRETPCFEVCSIGVYSGFGESVDRLRTAPAEEIVERGPYARLLSGEGSVSRTRALIRSSAAARGKDVDKRADIWAFGVVLYEMLTGKRLFRGETVGDILASVLKEPVDFDKAPASTRRLLRRCLERDPKQRSSNMHSRDGFGAWPYSSLLEWLP
jgi:serine/threonine protein kinase